MKLPVPHPGSRIVAPAGTPREIVAQLNAEVTKVLGLPEVKERVEKEGAELIPGTPERLAVVIEGDLVAWRKLIEKAGLELQ